MIRYVCVNQQYSLEEREKILAGDRQFSDTPGVFIKTCNRLELYFGEGEIPVELARHLFRVVSGLESNLIGEIAIQGQVKSAYLEASERFKLPGSLHTLFQTALSVGKRVRSESSISRGAMSHSNAVVNMVCNSGIDLGTALITCIGAHKLNEDIIRFMRSKGAETILLGNKNYEKAAKIASKYNCTAFRLEGLRNFLSFTDILITATAAPHLIVKKENFPTGKKMLIIDLAFPRDVDDQIGRMEHVTLHNLESIENHLSQNKVNRHMEIGKASLIIERELDRFFEKQHRYASRQVSC
jgi:glutamyl-tRNA reductase